MSIVRSDFNTIITIFKNSVKTIEFTVKDENGEVVDMSNSVIYNSGTVTIAYPDNTIIGTVPITFSNRENGLVTFPTNTSINSLPGGWKGHMDILNSDSTVIEQQDFNFIVKNIPT